MDQLNARAWILHWSLFMFFSNIEKTKSFIDLTQESSYEITMEVLCRHLLRYLLAALLLNHKKDTLRVVSEFVKKTGHKYADNFTEFIQILTQTFAFDQLPGVLEKLKQDCDKDYFLHPYADTVINEAKILIVNVYAKVYSAINVEYMSKVSCLSPENAIGSAQTAIKENGMYCTISEDKKLIVVTPQETNLNKRIADKGKELEERTKKLQEKLQPAVQSA